VDGSPCRSVKQTIAELERAIASKPDGIAFSRPDPPAFDAPVAQALDAGIPLVAFDVGGSASDLAYIGQDHYAAGRVAAATLAASAGVGQAILLAPAAPDAGIRRRLDGALGTLAHSGLKTVLISAGATPAPALAAAAGRTKSLRGILAFDPVTTAVTGLYVRQQGLTGRVHAGGFDLLPNHVDLVTGGDLDFVVDMQPYLLGFLPVLLLFLQKISQGILVPADVQIPPRILRAASIDQFVQTASRFEGSSSRHRYPLERA
jgi:simple sugar transport system substrate-binding protein